MKSLNYILIGPGKISHFHYEAFKKNAFNLKAIFSSSLKSKSLQIFLNKFDINKIYISENYNDINSEFLKKFHINLILLTTHVDITYKILEHMQNLKIPILVEKPVFSGQLFLNKFNEKNNFIKVAFNRRHYKNIIYLKKLISKKKDKINNLVINIPEKIFVKKSNHNQVYKKYYSNSAHIIDLIFYLFKDIKIISLNFFNKKNSRNFYVIFSFNNNLRGIINFFFNSPMNFEISFDIENLKYILNPIEDLRIYNSLEILEPSNDIPVRTYLPKIYKRINSYNDQNLKPGFNEQTIEIKKFIKNKKLKNNLANLEDAIKVQKFLIQLQKKLQKIK